MRSPGVESGNALVMRIPGVLVATGIGLMAALPIWLWPEISSDVDRGDLTWVLGIAGQNALLLLLLMYALRGSGAVRRAAWGEYPARCSRRVKDGLLDQHENRPASRFCLPIDALGLTGAVLLVYVADLGLLWWLFADGDPMVLDRALVVIAAAALLGGPAVAAMLAATAIPLRLLLVFVTEADVEPFGSAPADAWMSDHLWTLTEPGVLALVAAIASASVLARAFCRGANGSGSPCPLWTALALGLLIEMAYLGAARVQWGHDNWVLYWASEATADALATGLSITLILLLLRGLRGDIERIRAQEAELALAHERVDALRAQMQPHFLFNSLNTIHSLIVDRPDEARELVLDLSDLLRTVLTARGSYTTLDREIEFARQYAILEQARYGQRLALEYRIESGLGALQVPVLVLQPLVENAIKHGVAPYEDGGRVTVSADCRGDQLVLTVGDRHHGMGVDGAASASVSGRASGRAGGSGGGTRDGTGTGLRNIRQRLRLLYGESASLSLETDPERGSLVIVELPLQPRIHGVSET